MPYVERDINDEIVGLFARRQPGRAEEQLAADDAEVERFLARKPPDDPNQGPTTKQIWDALKAKDLVTDDDLIP